MNRYKLRIRLGTLMTAALLFLAAGCDLIDPTDVENPSITEEKLFEDATGGAAPLITGLEFAFSDAVGRTAIFTEVVSDNYDNTSTYISNIIDKPAQITPSENDLNDNREIYFKLQTLHSLSVFGLEVVLPADEEADDGDRAQAYFYKGMAQLMLAENFTAFPLKDEGPMISWQTAVSNAIADLKRSLELDGGGSNALRCSYALARAYRVAGDKANAVLEANNALGMQADYLLSAQHDAINLVNRVQLFSSYRRQNDIQPLPRLDWLDPKYTAEDDPIPVLSAEEMHLILAEASITDGDLASAKTHMINAIGVAGARPSYQWEDPDSRTDRPDGNNITVKAGPDASTVNGLIQARNGDTVTVYSVSAASLTAADINALTTAEEHYEALYQLRQEIFFGEGRRMSDLGIRLPVMKIEIDINPNVSYGMEGTYVVVPSYIPPGDQLDAFSYDANANIVTVTHDMNKLLAQNISTVSPFLR